MEETLKNGSLLAAVAALAFTIVGLLQWAISLTKANDKRRNELIKELEEARLENARLRGQLIIYADKLTDLNTKLREARSNYRHYKELFEQCDDHESPPRPAE